ncbi:MAG: SPOR domain-containing protein [Deltaproteobacteria bacterium]|nr:SPOR domain-containing protein [Deltaproteobacteria bacterium]
MEPKAELLVFNKKEITVIMVLLVLVSLFSFTLGLRLGKALGVSKVERAEQAPLAEKSEKKETATPASDHGDKESEHADAKGEEAGLPKAADSARPEGKTPVSPESGESAVDTGKKAEARADSEFAKEATKEKLVSGKTIPMSLPNEKKSEGDGPRFTIQVGSHRTVAEAAEQVTQLKGTGFDDAFYLAANVPGHGTRYRVGVGIFSSKDAAERTAGKWKATKKALPFYIVQRINE